MIAVGLALSAASLPAKAADVTVTTTRSGIAFGYNDGYWDQGHKWHAWQNREEADHFRAANQAHYFDRKHDAEKDQGWRETDRYWEHH
jgi:hypothetical protein